MMAGHHPFLSSNNQHNLTEKDVLDRIVGSNPEFPPTISKEAKSLILGVCFYDLT